MSHFRILSSVLVLSASSLPAARAQTTWYVDDDVCPGTGQGTPKDPFCRIQDGIEIAAAGDEVIVQPGVYMENVRLLGKAITLRSSGGEAITTIDAGGTGSAVTCNSGEGPETVLEGFTITGGNALFGGGMIVGSSSPTVTHCTFIGNTADFGGGMYNWFSAPTVVNCTFSANTTDHGSGGGMYNYNSSPAVINCMFIGNTAAGGGGGMCNSESAPTVTNCSYGGNVSSSNGGGMANINASPAVTNCLLWGDVPNEISSSGRGAAVVTFSNVQGGHPGEGNIDADPLYADALGGNLRLLSGSPCIDSGNNAAVPEELNLDLDGNARFVEDLSTPDCPQAPDQCGDCPVVDMGAYEYPEGSTTCCAFDFNGDGEVGPFDLAVLLGDWGPCPPPCEPGDPAETCAPDLDGDCAVAPLDLAILLGGWGPCEQ